MRLIELIEEKPDENHDDPRSGTLQRSCGRGTLNGDMTGERLMTDERALMALTGR
jgi:hypothetical protein